jgi:predicted RNase H-like HicB family nuclease
MNFDVEFEQEDNGRWIAEIAEIPGVLAYGVTPSASRSAGFGFACFSG